jgi:hypothetical protein
MSRRLDYVRLTVMMIDGLELQGPAPLHCRVSPSRSRRTRWPDVPLFCTCSAETDSYV